MLKKLCLASAVAFLGISVQAAEPVKIGFITPLSTPAGYTYVSLT